MKQLVISFLLVAIIGCKERSILKEIALPFYNHADFTPEWIEHSAAEYDEIHKIQNFEFLNQNGQTVDNETMFFSSLPRAAPLWFVSTCLVKAPINKHQIPKHICT